MNEGPTETWRSQLQKSLMASASALGLSVPDDCTPDWILVTAHAIERRVEAMVGPCWVVSGRETDDGETIWRCTGCDAQGTVTYVHDCSNRIPSRDVELRRQAQVTCEFRTRQLEDARTALARQAEFAELGRALGELMDQVQRLRLTPGVPFDFTPCGVADSVADELDEVVAVEPRSLKARAEIGDLLSTVISLANAHGAPVFTTITKASAKLRRRLDLMDGGCTWDEAKRAETSER